MIFRPELAKLIRQGRKSQTRRLGDTCRYEVGKSYSVQPGRGKPGICRITILQVRSEPLGAITLKDARKEGFVTTTEFFDYWKGLYGTVDREMPVWVLSFALGDLTDIPRLLAARPGAPHGDYVSESYLAMVDEGEAISAADAERFGKLAHSRDSQRLAAPLRIQRDQIAKALKEMRLQLPSQSGSVRDSVRRLERELAVLERKLVA